MLSRTKLAYGDVRGEISVCGGGWLDGGVPDWWSDSLLPKRKPNNNLLGRILRDLFELLLHFGSHLCPKVPTAKDGYEKPPC